MKINLFVLFASIILCLAACEEDPCDAVVCQNEGVCESGVCDCLLGYGGESCEILIRELIAGNFGINYDCGESIEATDDWGVFASASSLDAVLINNFHIIGLNVNATVTDANTIEIEEQLTNNSQGTFTVFGSGVIEEDGVFTIDYTIINEGLSETTTCSITATRK